MLSDEMVAEAIAELNKAMVKSLPVPHECKHQFSRKFERKMEKLISRVNHPMRYKVLSRVASILLVILLGFAAVMSCSPTVRAAVFGWVKKAYESFYSYYFDFEVATESDTTYQIDPLPEGFEEISNTADGGTHTYVFVNDQDELLIFVYSVSDDSSVFFLDQEGYLIENTMVSGENADLYLSKDGNLNNSIIWYDEEAGVIFFISGQFDRDKLIGMAERVK